jgi:hypothetical protein
MSDSGDDQATPTARTPVDVRVPAGAADPAELWTLLSTPALWPAWAPHIRRAERVPGRDDGPGGASVRTGDTVKIHGLGPMAVTALIALVDPPRRWDFVVALPLSHQLVATHELVDDPAGVRVRMALHGPLPSPLGRMLLRAYQPLATVAVRRLVALAADPDRRRPATTTEHTER